MAIAVIFSKDRACQLHLILESIFRNTDDNLFSMIHVIYKATTPEYKQAYIKAAKHFDVPRSKVLFYQEQDFKQDLLCILKQEQTYEQKYVCFFTDDDIVYQPISLTEHSLDQIFSIDKVGVFSFRLGTNIVMQDLGANMTTFVPALTKYSVSGINDEVIVWDWSVCPHHLDFGYPLSVDGHVFRLKDIIPITESVEAPQPNSYEGNMCHRLNMLPPLAIAFLHSKVVNTPINRCQNDFHNRHGDFFPKSLEELNNSYLNDKIIDYDKIDFSNIVCSYQELSMEFK